jgi:hypothetical protein
VKPRVLAFIGVMALAFAAPSAGQPPAGQPPAGQAPLPLPPAPGEGHPISAGQIQRWFEAYTVLQAQEALALSEAQYGRFVTRLKSLQEVRRRHQQSRNRILNDLRRLTMPQGTQPAQPAQAAAPDESAIAERLRALRDEDDQGAADVKKAYSGVDETLDIRQQARFRIFEERMEQQKLELLMRARQNARANRARGK